ncbi:hypothetical protein VTK56DRAFT_5798 [Thermocarpiscus australiensis]
MCKMARLGGRRRIVQRLPIVPPFFKKPSVPGGEYTSAAAVQPAYESLCELLTGGNATCQGKLLSRVRSPVAERGILRLEKCMVRSSEDHPRRSTEVESSKTATAFQVKSEDAKQDVPVAGFWTILALARRIRACPSSGKRAEAKPTTHPVRLIEHFA